VAPPSATGSAALGWLGRLVRKLIEGPVGTVARFLSRDHNVLDVLERRAVHDSADFIAAAMPEALAFRSRETLWDYAIRNAERHGLWLEFGVFKGYSINYLARRTNGRVFGFDSFHGLQEDWKGVGHTRGTFDLSGRLPHVRSNVSLVAGWFSDTLPGFLAANPGPVSLLHLDCDTYEATAEVLGMIMERLTPKTIIIMDDYHGFWGYRDGQFRAWAEFVAAHGLVYRYAAFNRHAVVVCNIQSEAPEPPREQAVPQ
jgi:Methyltransferase domain